MEELTKIEQDKPINRKLFFFIRETPGYYENITDQIVIREIFDENVYQLTTKDVCDGIVLDIGANVGIFSIYASLLGAKKVIAYEPEEDNGIILKKNVEANNLTNIELRPFAVSSKEETFEIYKSQGATKRIDYAPGVDWPKQTVKAQNINKILGELKEVAVMKLDCEGAEYDILAGATSENLKKCAYIVVEFHNFPNTTAEIYGAMMAKLSLTHNVHVFGQFDQGGQLYARRY